MHHHQCNVINDLCAWLDRNLSLYNQSLTIALTCLFSVTFYGANWSSFLVRFTSFLDGFNQWCICIHSIYAAKPCFDLAVVLFFLLYQISRLVFIFIDKSSLLEVNTLKCISDLAMYLSCIHHLFFQQLYTVKNIY